MPAGWNDLSNEIRKIIIEYVVADKTVSFTPRHAATRGARKKHETIAQEPPHFPLLLVSKQFLTYAELNDAVLKNATINYQSERDLTMLDARFGKGGIENIRTLRLDYSVTTRWVSSRHTLPKIPSKLQSRLQRLQKITADIKLNRLYQDTHVSVLEVITVAKGQCLSPDADLLHPWIRTTAGVQAFTRGILQMFLYRFRGKAFQWFVEFLEQRSEETFEKLVRFELDEYHLTCRQHLQEVGVISAVTYQC